MNSKLKHLPKPDTKWADGLRGIASLFVVSSHVTLCFARSVVPPSLGADGPVKLFQRPFLRLIGQGNAAVAIFFVLLGFVNSLKTIQLSRAGYSQEALSGLSTGLLRRSGRLVFPAAVVTVISWFFCQLGMYGLARRSDAYWLQATSPFKSESWIEAISDLLRELVATWEATTGENKYDQPQWALHHLFEGSLYIYLALLATVNATPAFRLLTVFALYVYSLISHSSIVGYNVFAGMLLAELAHMPTPKQTSKFLSILPYALAILGLFFCSYPDSFADQAPWSRELQSLGLKIFPQDPYLGRWWPGLGAQILCLSITYSPSMRRALSTKYLLWLGGLSYAIYLIHGTLMRTVMTWLVFGPNAILGADTSDVEGWGGQGEPPPSIVQQPSAPLLLLILPVFGAIVLYAANFWTVKVDPLFGKATAKLEHFSKNWRSESQGVNSPTRKEGGGRSILPTSNRTD